MQKNRRKKYADVARLAHAFVAAAGLLSSFAAQATIVPGSTGGGSPNHGCAKIFAPGTRLGSAPRDADYLLRRGSEGIPLKKAADRFSISHPTPEQRQNLLNVAGISRVEALDGETWKVEVDPNQRDQAMATARASGIIAHHAYGAAGIPDTRYYVTDHVTLKFRNGVDQKKIDQLFRTYKLEISQAFPSLGQTFVAKVTTESGANPVRLADRILIQNPGILEYTEPLMINRWEKRGLPPIEDSSFSQQWYLDAPVDGVELKKGADINVRQAWATTKGKGATVAVLDDFPDLTHPDLQPTSMRSVLPFWDTAAGQLPDTATDKDYHHTPVASIAIGAENKKGMVGVAPEANYWPIRINMNNADAKLAGILLETAKRADVINISWGPPPVYVPISKLLADTLQYIATQGGPRGKGCFVVIAAGNSNAPIQLLGTEINLPAHWKEWIDNNGPVLNGMASHPFALAVGASTSLLERAAYSSWGWQLRGVTPSSNFEPGNPRKKLPGRPILAADSNTNGSGGMDPGSYTNRFGGTSAAAPILSGILALMRSVDPDLTFDQAIEILKLTSDAFEDTRKDPMWNWPLGVYDYKSGHSLGMGYGKFNAGKAVELVKARLQSSP